MLKQDARNYVNSLILTQARNLQYIVKVDAPSDEKALFNESSLVIWSGASQGTIYQDERVNWAFRALHDDLHLKTRLNFSIESEIELGRIQASKYSSGLMQDFLFSGRWYQDRFNI